MLRNHFPHLVQMDSNTKGNDYVIGDVHGCDSLLQQIKLEPNDRLFIVGDLIDRGPNSLNVINIVKNNPAMLTVRGNHEDMCLKAISQFSKRLIPLNKQSISTDLILTLQAATDYTAINSCLENPQFEHALWRITLGDIHLTNYVANGGMWLILLILKEIKEDKIRFINEANIDDDDSNLIFEKTSQVKMIRDYIQSLPYIISVNGNDSAPPFHIVHADMLLDDESLKKRMQDNPYLQQDEIQYITWARTIIPDPLTPLIKPTGRHFKSERVYCGHSIVTHGAQSVRPTTNTVNLDGGAYFNNAFLFLNHTKNAIEILRDEKANQAEFNTELDFHVTNISMHLNGMSLTDILRNNNRTASYDSPTQIMTQYEGIERLMEKDTAKTDGEPTENVDLLTCFNRILTIHLSNDQQNRAKKFIDMLTSPNKNNLGILAKTVADQIKKAISSEHHDQFNQTFSDIISRQSARHLLHGLHDLTVQFLQKSNQDRLIFKMCFNVIEEYFTEALNRENIQLHSKRLTTFLSPGNAIDNDLQKSIEELRLQLHFHKEKIDYTPLLDIIQQVELKIKNHYSPSQASSPTLFGKTTPLETLEKKDDIEELNESLRPISSA